MKGAMSDDDRVSGVLGILERRLDREAPEGRTAIAALYKAMKDLCGLSMPLEQSVCSDDYKDSFLRNKNVNIMQNSVISTDCDIGEYTYIGYNSHVTRTNIGRYCSIGNNVSLGPGEHPDDQVSTSAYFITDVYAKLTASACVIDHDVWIGADSIVRRGVRVGLGAIVGANSFVNADVPPFAVVAGSPAKLIRFRLDEVAVSRILVSRWWEDDLPSARIKVSKLTEELGL